MKTLQIPTASRDYGHILKLSDAEYNERLVKEMAEKRLLALDRKAQLENGDPVYIPPKKRGPLSEEHKRHISEAQIRSWQENPERIYEMSERQKEYYRENPERVEDFKRVLNKAWNIFGADNIKKAMSKFFKTKKVSMFDIENPIEMTKEQSKTLKIFWGQNEWARKSFSKNMKHAWKKVKEENEMVFTIPSIPTKLAEMIEKLAGVEKGSLDFETKFNPYTRISSINEKANAIYCEVSDKIPDLPNIMADTFQIAVLKLAEKISNLDFKKLPKNYSELKLYTQLLIANNFKENGKYAVQTTIEAQQDFLKLASIITELKCGKAKPLILKSLDEAFEASYDFHQMTY